MSIFDNYINEKYSLIFMQREKKVNYILRQFKKKSKKIINKDYFTEFFYINENREVIEFLRDNNRNLIIDIFFKKFLPEEFSNFVNIKIMNFNDEEVNLWYYSEENLILLIEVNWGFKKQEISIDLDIENFEVRVVEDDEEISRKIDYTFFNEYLISFLTIQARNLAEIYNKISK